MDFIFFERRARGFSRDFQHIFNILFSATCAPFINTKEVKKQEKLWMSIWLREQMTFQNTLIHFMKTCWFHIAVTDGWQKDFCCEMLMEASHISTVHGKYTITSVSHDHIPYFAPHANLCAEILYAKFVKILQELIAKLLHRFSIILYFTKRFFSWIQHQVVPRERGKCTL